MLEEPWNFVEGENVSSWNWFMDLLRKDLRLGDGRGCVIISDQQKGLVHAVRDYLPNVEQRMCVRHLYANWRKHFKGKELRKQYWAAAKSSSMCEMWMYLNRMVELNPGGFVKMKETLHPKFWCRAFFNDQSKCDSVDSNICETFNCRIIEARSLPIISMLEEIRIYVMRKMVEKRDAGLKWKEIYAPRIAKEIASNKKKSHCWSIEYNGVDGYEVSHKDHRFVVYLGKMEDYVSDWYKLPTYLKAYSYMMEPVRGVRDWPIVSEPTLLQPIDRRMPGRPKLNKRRLEEAERALQQEGATHVPRLGRRMVCTICHKPDHNKRTCPDKDKEKQGNCPSQPQCEMTAGPSQPPPTQEQAPPTQEQNMRGPQSTRVPTGYGVYINPETGEHAINPGTMPTRGRGRVAAAQGND